MIMELTCKSISKEFGKTKIINTLDLNLIPGVYALLGPNGAGKTTLLRMIATVLKPTEGTIVLNGKNIFEDKDYQKKLGYLPQYPQFYDNYNAYEMLSYIGKLKGISKVDLKVKIPAVLKSVNLEDVDNKLIKYFSGGMKQRLGLAQALLNDPEIIILDEPTSGLDPKERINFRNMIASLKKDRIILIATHIVSDIDKLADSIMLFNHGKIIMKGTTAELCNPIANYVVEFEIDDINNLEGINISTLNYENQKYCVRAVTKEFIKFPHQKVEPNLDDVYLYYFGVPYDL